ncbi:VaFE repeat-containing surface-anchored protein [Staphylococcus chromogenes]|nr:VaFE repeat-containing surface-anchored protein [Staphylococcus chromogenes]
MLKDGKTVVDFDTAYDGDLRDSAINLLKLANSALREGRGEDAKTYSTILNVLIGSYPKGIEFFYDAFARGGVNGVTSQKFQDLSGFELVQITPGFYDLRRVELVTIPEAQPSEYITAMAPLGYSWDPIPNTQFPGSINYTMPSQRIVTVDQPGLDPKPTPTPTPTEQPSSTPSPSTEPTPTPTVDPTPTPSPVGPSIGTTAGDAAGAGADNDTHTVEFAAGQSMATVTDTVSYTGLTPGKLYLIEGKLMTDVSTTPVAATAWKTFVPTEANGTVTVDFPVNVSWAGHKLVAFETLSLVNIDSNGSIPADVNGKPTDVTEVAKHEDINDLGQTVTVEKQPTSTPSTVTTTATTTNTTVVTSTSTTAVPTTVVQTTTVNNTPVTTTKTITETVPTTVTTTKTQPATSTEPSTTAPVTTEPTTPAGPVKIGTTASDVTDGDKNVNFPANAAKTDVKMVKDVIAYEGLIPGKMYLVEGELMTGDAANPVAAKAWATFVPKTANGTFEVNFPVTASWAGKKLVAFETVSLVNVDANGKVIGSDANGKPTDVIFVAEHKDMGDKAQTVEVTKENTPSTTPVVPGNEVPAETAKIELKKYIGDQQFKGSEVKQESGIAGAPGVLDAEQTAGAYFAKVGQDLKITFAVKNTGALDLKNVSVTDQLISGPGFESQPVENIAPAAQDIKVGETVYFTATVKAPKTGFFHGDVAKATGTPVDGNGKEVPFKDDKGNSHKPGDKVTSNEDKAHSVTPGDDILLRTTATDKADGDKELAMGGAVVVDRILYTGLTVGNWYTVTGELMDKATGAPTGIKAWKTFQATTQNGSVDVEFEVPAGYAGKSLVAFETLFNAKLDSNGKPVTGDNGKNEGGSTDVPPVTGGEKPVGQHTDITDGNQTVNVTNNLRTTAVDKADTDKIISENGGVIVDTVDFTGLVPGQEYILTGTLMDKKTGQPVKDAKTGETVTAVTRFVPAAANGQTKIEFNLNKETAQAYKGHELVVFEEASQEVKPGEKFDGREVKDIVDNTGKTVTVVVVGKHADINDAAQTVGVGKPGDFPWLGLIPLIPLIPIIGGGLVGSSEGGNPAPRQDEVRGISNPAPRQDQVMGVSNPAPANKPADKVLGISKAPKSGVLANTGASVIGIAGIAFALIVLGALLVLRRKEA